LPNSVIVSVMQWEKSSGDAMVAIYNDADDEDDFGKYFQDGNIVSRQTVTLSDM